MIADAWIAPSYHYPPIYWPALREVYEPAPLPEEDKDGR